MRYRWCGSFAALAAALGACAYGDPAQDARKAVQAQYDYACAAEARKDAAALISIFAPGYLFIDKSGQKHTLAEVKKRTQDVFFQAKSISDRVKIVSFSVSGTTAHVRVQEHSKLIGPDPVTNSEGIVLIDSTKDDVWTLVKGKWLQSRSKMLSSTPTLNGRPPA